MQALKETKYRKEFQYGMFDEEDQFGGWGFVTNKIFQLPRSEKYNQVLEARARLIKMLLKKKF